MKQGQADMSDLSVLMEGERLLGRYTIVVLQTDSNDRWFPSLMQLNAAITNYRLTLRPFRKKYSPATLPSRYIAAFEQTRVGGYNCIRLDLKTGHSLYLMLSTGHLEHLYEDLCAMTAPPPRFQFDDRISPLSIQRLIQFFDLLAKRDAIANTPQIE